MASLGEICGIVWIVSMSWLGFVKTLPKIGGQRDAIHLRILEYMPRNRNGASDFLCMTTIYSSSAVLLLPSTMDLIYLQTRWNQSKEVSDYFVDQLLLESALSCSFSRCCGDEFERSSSPPGYFSLVDPSFLWDPWIQTCFRPEFFFQCQISSVVLHVMIKPSNWNQTYGTIHNKLTFLEVNERCITFPTGTLSLCVHLFLSGLYLSVALLKHCHNSGSSGLLHPQLDATFLGFKLNV